MKPGQITLTSGMLGLVFAGWLLASAADVVRPGEEAAPHGKLTVHNAMRISKINGMAVRNIAGERLGTIDDLVVNLETGQIAYVTLGVGGILGVGEKLYGVPYQDVRFDMGNDETFAVLDISKQKLETAPSFDRRNWPDFADTAYVQKIDDFYGQNKAEVRTRNVEPK
jgi:sporulation protein YlmC with PRC-barrel domain